MKNQGNWNVKRNAKVWSDTLGISANSYNKTVFFYGRPVVIDDIGNITYGYLGRAARFSRRSLKRWLNGVSYYKSWDDRI